MVSRNIMQLKLQSRMFVLESLTFLMAKSKKVTISDMLFNDSFSEIKWRKQ